MLLFEVGCSLGLDNTVLGLDALDLEPIMLFELGHPQSQCLILL